MFRKLSKNEYMYCWYIEYGEPYHYIPTPPEIGACIKKLIADGICIQLPNPTLENSPLYTRFTREGRILFLVHQWIMRFKHPYDDENIHYDEIMKRHDLKSPYEEILNLFNL